MNKKFKFKITSPINNTSNTFQTDIKEYFADEIYSQVPEYDKKDKVLIIDFDIFAYKIASVCEFKFKFFNEEEGLEMKVKSKSYFKMYCEDNGYEYSDFECISIQEAEPISYAIKTVKDSLNKVLEFTGCNKFEVYVGGSDNFRQQLPLNVEYKSSRKDLVRPIHLTAIKNYGLTKLGGYKVKGVEADDVVQHRMRTLHNQGIRCVLYSNDKDAKQNVDYSMLIYNPDKVDIELSVGGVGILEERSVDVKGTGLKWLLFQLMLGDPIDTYTPKPFFNKRYADKSFYKDFDKFTNERELLDAFIKKWKQLIPQEVIEYVDWQGNHQKHNWLSLLELYYKCCKMNDGWCNTFESLIDFYGMDIGEYLE